MYKLVIIRHGQTAYNLEKKFCGWTDAELTEKGVEQARLAGQALKNAHLEFDIAYSSVLKRAMNTLSTVLGELGESNIPVNYSWRLNERHYGALQELMHADVEAKYSPEQVHKWRRSFADKPLQLTKDDPRYPGFDPKYKDLDPKDLPLGESLEDTIKRVMPYWNSDIVPMIKSGKRVIISASNNSIRAMVKHIDGIGDDEIVGIEIKNAVPLIYELDENLKPLKRYYLLSDGTEQPL
jgi:2,3-bisphosphoglycerate-dependent phosphoglycerate mutase